LWSCSCCGEEGGLCKSTEVANQERKKLLCSIPAFALFSGSCSQFSPLQTIFTDQLIYLLNSPCFSHPFSTVISPLNLSSVEEVCHDKDQKRRGRGVEMGEKRRMQKNLEKEK